MTLNKDEIAVLKALVKQEIKEIEEKGEDFPVRNSPVLSSIYRMKETDISFMKNRTLYLEFLKSLLKKL